ncbi:MAG: sigma-54 dependent transcriptional regulator [Gammaproteobacteria bacterium]|nr:sigma-54 dependent transcriptional regulator [Gammaproteobacteria bacterium]MDH3406547.1 sigma-54 dependent transcriptional regulator [Gammaproteobacteria bacterium]MDH3562139.1 sigma-54 dependent transcriptional regulator [Gammaproteobacteria bacterium]
MKRTVLVVDDEQNMQTVMRMVLENAGHEVLIADSGESALVHAQNPNLDVVLTDLRMPGMGGEEFVIRCRKERPDVPVIIVTAHGTIRSAVKSIHDGAADYLTKPFEPEQLEIVVHNAIKLRDILRENTRLKAEVNESRGTKRLVGEGRVAQQLLEEIRRVAPYKTGVLITGESGTGKELVARTIHELSPRRERPWVALNCSAIPRDLLESELFGYIKGAFTGATHNRAGRLEQAQGGTLFLDEIADLDASLQSKLLRVLQEREFSPVGSNQVRAVDVRFIAATNRELKALVQEGKFREDLLYRLDVYSIVAPPLRSRREDIPLLAQTFLQELAAETDKRVTAFTPAALEALAGYAWPGNVRELRNTVERSLLSCQGTTIDIGDLPGAIVAPSASAAGEKCKFEKKGKKNLDHWLEAMERDAILEALAQTRGVQTHAAKKLGISERSLWHRIKKLNIQINRVIY